MFFLVITGNSKEVVFFRNTFEKIVCTKSMEVNTLSNNHEKSKLIQDKK